MIKDDFDDNSDNSATNHNIDVRKILFSFRIQDILKLAYSRWKLARSEVRESWKVRANYLNSKPLPGRLIALPPALEVNLLSTLLYSLTSEWFKFASDLTIRLKRPKKTIQDDIKGGVIYFGSERVIIRNEVARTMRMIFLLRLSIFGREHANLRGDEIIERKKKGCSGTHCNKRNNG